jgi:hypothetical protein
VPLDTRETVATDTPAMRAISRTVRRLLLPITLPARNVAVAETGYSHTMT